MYVDKWIGFEKQCKKTVEEYQGEGEMLLPASIYVVVAGFGASILTKNRIIYY